MRSFITSIIFILYFNGSSRLFAQDIMQNIRVGEYDSVVYFLSKGHNIDSLYPDYTPMELAVKYNQIRIANLLLERGAEVNRVNNGNTLLLWAIFYSGKFKDTSIVTSIVDHGADINKKGNYGATPLIYACMTNNYPVAKLLFLRGANLFLEDNGGHEFFYYVLRGNDFRLLNFFLHHNYTIPQTSSNTDGPYLKYIDNRNAVAEYIQYDSLSSHAELLSDTFNISDEHFRFKDPVNNKIKTIYISDVDHDQDVFNRINKIFAIGDIHGNYKVFTDLLKGNKIVDEKLNWIWGNGHLVICGDVFDRGDRVLDCLWLIYKLELQAKRSGGCVHYILGNHELMIMVDDNKNYVNDKLLYTSDRLGINYTDFFSSQYVLGQWLRNHNAMVKINNILFIHGGIPPEYPRLNVTINQVNTRIKQILLNPTDSIDHMIYNFSIRPLWYRGYFGKEDLQQEIFNALHFYSVSQIVVGHTPVNEISVLHGGKIIAINVPFGYPGIKPEALLITNRKFYKVDEFGNKVLLKVR